LQFYLKNTTLEECYVILGVIVCANAEGPKSALANTDSANTAERRTLALVSKFYLLE
jgi:hypothetical protein